jgi:hypothetical protein
MDRENDLSQCQHAQRNYFGGGEAEHLWPTKNKIKTVRKSFWLIS